MVIYDDDYNTHKILNKLLNNKNKLFFRIVYLNNNNAINKIINFPN